MAICCMSKETKEYLIDAVERWIDDNRHVLDEGIRTGAFNRYRQDGARKGIYDMEEILQGLKDMPVC